MIKSLFVRNDCFHMVLSLKYYKKMVKKIYKNEKGFTLIELITVIAIIGILAITVLVSISAQKERALTDKVLTEISGVIPNIYLCLSDDGTVSAPDGNGGNNICNLSSGYGVWPAMPSDFAYQSVSGNLNGDSWSLGVSYTGSGGGENICCTSKAERCGKIASGTACTVNTVIK